AAFQLARSWGLRLCLRQRSAWLAAPLNSSRTTWALNSGAKKRRRPRGMKSLLAWSSIHYGTGPAPGAHHSRFHLDIPFLGREIVISGFRPLEPQSVKSNRYFSYFTRLKHI